MNGISDKLFDPYGTLTRGMVVTILYRLEGTPEVAYNGTFADVPDGKWFTDGVEWAASKGIVNGYSNGKWPQPSAPSVRKWRSKHSPGETRLYISEKVVPSWERLFS